MRAVLLGTAAGGGVPQWNCACPGCRGARAGRHPARAQDCLAISADGASWYLVNASPDIRTQLLGCPALAPGPGARETPLRGVLLTDGELDHTTGLFQLKEAGGLTVHAPEPVLTTLPARAVLAPYARWDWRIAGSGELGGLRVDVLPVSGKRPKYAADAPGTWVVAYRFTDPATGGRLVYAPCLAGWPFGFEEFCAGADVVLLDGSFHGSAEMSGATGGDVGDPAQRAMGHLPMAGPGGSLRKPRPPGARLLYTHLNNTNPVLDESSPEHAAMRAAGAELAPEGAELVL
ncbi:pyrroloquinoline quinone biosynthesis protein PqqB [Saccharopolyspora cebuensis]|uniref:Coenzyme PQQ synthesis protein B n=1 Tax=Saccharopolyspora cebuensis TaxID=418759 RepID=A0ABV4CR46_9PSEU